MKRTFDRIARFDEQSRAYPIRAMVTGKPVVSRLWDCNTWLDQGSEGACTGFAVSHEACADPAPIPDITNETARAIYHEAKKHDQWDGEAYEGSSVLGAMKAAVLQGWYIEYRWAFSERDIALAVAYSGPVVMGTDWHEGMSKPDVNGIISMTGEMLGGHAYLIRGIDVATGMYRIRNSWNKDWGLDGDCFVKRDVIAKLMSNFGEACVPTVRCT